jgi:N-acetylglucosaminyl-diphospho-decaprenol L-rhamnosyltransferase
VAIDADADLPAMPLTVCVIIPALRPDGVVHALQCVAGACDAAIVVDNSGGAVREAVREHAPWASVIQPDGNIGFGAAVHLAALESREDILLLLNDDVEPRPNFVAEAVKPFADPHVHQVACSLLVAGSSRTDSVGLSFDRTLRADNVHRVEWGRPVHPLIGPSGAAAAYRRTTYLGVGGFAPQLFAYWEDSDLALRMWAAGYGCAFAPRAVADHARGTALQGRSSRQRELDAYGRGFVLGRYRAWLGPLDRALVPLVDWPSLLRGCLVTRSIVILRARRAGRRAGSLAEPVKRPPGSPATRTVRQTLAAQLKSFLGGTQEAVPDAVLERVLVEDRDVRASVR